MSSQHLRVGTTKVSEAYVEVGPGFGSRQKVAIDESEVVNNLMINMLANFLRLQTDFAPSALVDCDSNRANGNCTSPLSFLLDICERIHDYGAPFMVLIIEL